MREPLLRISNLTLRFGGTTAINDFSEDVYDGELLAIVGPNGAGKTSVFNSISGTVRPNGGQIMLAGQELLGRRPDQVAKLGVARTFQSQELFPMTVVENVLAGRHAKMRTGLLRAALFVGPARQQEVYQRRRTAEILDFLEIGRHAQSPVARLPLSVQKRVEIGRALALEPRVLMLDEPTAGMNRTEKEDIARLILRIRRETGIAVVLIEHDMRFVMDLSDRVCVMNFGEKLAVGSPMEVTKDPEVIRAYLGGQSE